jgi:hypothetical protein
LALLISRPQPAHASARVATQRRRLWPGSRYPFAGKPIGQIAASWQSAGEVVGVGRHDTPHAHRRSAATVFMASGTDAALMTGYLGIGADVLQGVHGRYHPMSGTNAPTTPRNGRIDGDGGDRDIAQIVDLSEVV